MFISRKRYEEAIEQAKVDGQLIEIQRREIDDLQNDICEIKEKIKDLEYRANSTKDGFSAVWRALDNVQSELTRMTAI